MAKGIVYVMSTVVDGLVKIGRTNTDNFEQRMTHLESNGYRNVTGLKRQFAIEVENFEEKETLLHSLFSRSRLSNTELFSLNLNEVIQLLSSFEGQIIYPKEKKSEVFEQATEAMESALLPDGQYTGKVGVKSGRKDGVATITVTNGQIVLTEGSAISSSFSCKTASLALARQAMSIENDVLQEDFACKSPSMAAVLVTGQNRNGWEYWKDSAGKPIDQFRQKKKDED